MANRYWSITQSTTGNFDPSLPSGQGRINSSHWEIRQTLDFFVPIINVSWFSATNAAAVELAFVAETPEFGPAAANRILLFSDGSGLLNSFEWTNYGRGRRVPYIGSRSTRYSLELLTRGVIGSATWTVEVWWERGGENTECPTEQRPIL